MKLTLFDLDGTLLPGDSDHAFGQFLIALGWADAQAHRLGNDFFYASYLDGTLDIAAYTEFATRPWRDRPAQELDAAMARFMAEVVQPDLHAAALALVREHQEAGDLVAIVTATNEFVTAPIAQAFGVDALIATQLQRDAQGRVTGALQGTPSFREGKISRVHDWLAGQGLSLADFERSTFYSDSPNDLPLMECVTHPVATNPVPALAQIAQARGWPVLSLFT